MPAATDRQTDLCQWRYECAATLLLSSRPALWTPAGVPALLRSSLCPCSLRLLRLEKSYWLRLEDRWTRASLRAIARLQRERPDLQARGAS